jgi:hypothetical protein
MLSLPSNRGGAYTNARRSVRLAGWRSSTEGFTSGPSRSEVKYRTPLPASCWYSAAGASTRKAGEWAGPLAVCTATRYWPILVSPLKSRR